MRGFITVLMGVVSFVAGCAAVKPAHVSDKSVPVIYCTDLFHPHDDPDDHFDLACIYALRGIDLRAIILDQGAKQHKKPGQVPVSQMNAITGRDVPACVGLSEPLDDSKDKAEDQPAEYQAGVECIIRTLEQSDQDVTIVTVGSVRDLMAAYNRRPGLLRRKVRGVYAFIGEASDPAFEEYNVSVDVQAYVSLMRSDLPVYWIPCFDGGLWKNAGRASYWKAPHRDLLTGVSDPVMNFFIYALTLQEAEPLSFLRRPVDPELEARVLGLERHLWCCAVFQAVTGKRIVRQGETFVAVEQDQLAGRVPIFDFEPINMQVSRDGVVTEVADGGKRLQRFRVVDREHFAEAMTAVTARMLRSIAPLNPD